MLKGGSENGIKSCSRTRAGLGDTLKLAMVYNIRRTTERTRERTYECKIRLITAKFAKERNGLISPLCK